MPAIALRRVHLQLESSAGPVNILRGIDLAVGRGEAVSVVGPSGSGKSRSEEHTSELQSLMRISYAVFCLKKKNTGQENDRTGTDTTKYKQTIKSITDMI